jgi:hypothetical protein
MNEILNWTYQQLETEFSELIKSEIFPEIKRDITIFDVLGITYDENVISNFYEYFLNDNQHNFGSLFLDSLLELVNEQSGKNLSFTNWIAQREISTRKGGRIDILIEGVEEDEGKALILENKIYHTLDNDLDDYWDSVRYNEKKKIGVVLSLEKIQDINQSQFINITHRQYLNQVESNLGKHFKECKPSFLTYLKEFFTTIENLYSEDMKDSMAFYIQNHEKIAEITALQEGITRQVMESTERVFRKLNIKAASKRPKNYRDFVVRKRPHLTLTVYFEPLYQCLPSISLYYNGAKKEEAENLIFDKTYMKPYTEKGLEIRFEERGKSLLLVDKLYKMNEEEFTDYEKTLLMIYETEWLPIIQMISKSL